jgi:hypothetical protein
MIKRIVTAVLKGMSYACSSGDHMGCPGHSCNCSCH